jgi:hypothetical protein
MSAPIKSTRPAANRATHEKSNGLKLRCPCVSSIISFQFQGFVPQRDKSETSTESKLDPERFINMNSNTDIVRAVSRSRVLSKEEAGDGLVLTIDEVREETIGHGAKAEKKLLVYFREDNVKPLALNKSRAVAIAGLLGGSTPSDWIGKEIEVYLDPTITFGGERTGGIGVRAPQVLPL